MLFIIGLSFTPGCHLHQWLHQGFKVGPEYFGPPNAEVAADWIDEDERISEAPPSDVEWWSVFDDPVLEELISFSRSQNLDLQQAGWRVMQARAQRAIAVGELLPQTQQAFGDYSRILESDQVATPPPLKAFDSWSAGLTLAWELDVWGRYRRQIAAADANLQASQRDFDAILLTLITDVALAYTDYRTFQQRLDYARDNVDIQKKSLQLTTDQADLGSTGYTGVALAKASLASTEASIPELEIGLRQSSNQLCTLLGIPPQQLYYILGDGKIPAAPAKVAIGIPAELIRRRPDVAVAERQMAIQSEQIGIAVSDLYPHFSINGEFAFDSERFKDLFSSGSSAGSVGPSMRWDVLNYGRISNNVLLQDARFQELVAAYRSSVLTANQEVEDALVAYLRNQQRVKFLETTVNEQQEALRLLLLSFEDGAIDFSTIFLVQGTLVNSQDLLAATEGDVAASLIQLYKALGGGWESRAMQGTVLGFDATRPTDSSSEEIMGSELPVAPEATPAVPGGEEQ